VKQKFHVQIGIYFFIATHPQNLAIHSEDVAGSLDNSTNNRQEITTAKLLPIGCSFILTEQASYTRSGWNGNLYPLCRRD
jgi:hypothetical protein